MAGSEPSARQQRQASRERVGGHEIAELLDLRHVAGRDGQLQRDMVGDLETGGLTGVLHGADHVAGVAFGQQIIVELGVEDHETAGRRARTRSWRPLRRSAPPRC